jgi:hypothetical protein
MYSLSQKPSQPGKKALGKFMKQTKLSDMSNGMNAPAQSHSHKIPNEL